MWICICCESKNKEQDAFCAVCGARRPDEIVQEQPIPSHQPPNNKIFTNTPSRENSVINDKRPSRRNNHGLIWVSICAATLLLGAYLLTILQQSIIIPTPEPLVTNTRFLLPTANQTYSNTTNNATPDILPTANQTDRSAVNNTTPDILPTANQTEKKEKTAAEYLGGFLANASSVYKLKYNNDYSVDPSMVVDGDLRTAWNEGADGDGTGEWIELTPASDENLIYNGFRIANGFQYHDYHKGDRWIKNNRVKMLSVEIDGSWVGTFQIEDLENGYQEINFNKPLQGHTLRFVIESTYGSIPNSV